jgi:hypothetical protein
VIECWSLCETGVGGVCAHIIAVKPTAARLKRNAFLFIPPRNQIVDAKIQKA